MRRVLAATLLAAALALPAVPAQAATAHPKAHSRTHVVHHKAHKPVHPKHKAHKVPPRKPAPAPTPTGLTPAQMQWCQHPTLGGAWAGWELACHQLAWISTPGGPQ